MFMCCKLTCDFVKIANFLWVVLSDLSVSGSTEPVKYIDQRGRKMKCATGGAIRNCLKQNSFLISLYISPSLLLTFFFCYKLSPSASSANILGSFCMSRWCKLPQPLAPISWASSTPHVSPNTLCVSVNAVALQSTAATVRKTSRRK